MPLYDPPNQLLNGPASATLDTAGALSASIFSGSTLLLAGTGTISGALNVSGVMTIASVAAAGNATIQTLTTNAGILFEDNRNANSAGTGLTFAPLNSPRTAGKIFDFRNGTNGFSLGWAGSLSSSYAESLTAGTAATLNAGSGRFVVSAASATFTLTDNAIAAGSIIHVIPETSDATFRVKSATPTLGTGSIALVAGAGNVTCSFQVFNGL